MQPLNYLTTTSGIIWTAACVPMGVFLMWLAYFIINRIPASWLCDYGETPSAELLSGKRVRYVGSGILMSVITVLCLVCCRLQFNKGYDIYFTVFGLIIVIALMIAVCDIKYTIIPDQFTIAVALIGIFISVYDIVRGYGLLHTSWWSPLAGAVMGGGAMLLIDFIGMIIYKKTGMGFGDVKLFAAVGIITGFPGTLYAFAISLVTGLIGFAVIIVASKFFGGVDADAAEGVAEAQTEETGVAAVTDSKPEEVPSAAEITADVAEANEEAQDQTEDEGNDGAYLAFGPYIAIALIVYLSLYDIVQSAANLYLGLFK